MKTGRSIVELAQEIDRQRQAKRDFIADTNVVQMSPMGNELVFKTNGEVEAFGIKDFAHRQIGERVGIPAKYYDKMLQEQPELLATNVNTWFQVAPEKRMIRTLDGNVRAFLSNGYRSLDNYDLVEATFPTIQQLGMDILSCEITDRRLYIKAVTERISGEIKKGDVVQAGISIMNSEIGAGSLRVEPLIYTLACLNGMIVQKYGMRKYHVGRRQEEQEIAELFSDQTKRLDDAAFWNKVRDLVRGVLKQDVFDQIVGTMREATEQPIEGNPVKAVEVTQKQFALSDGETSGVIQNLIKDGDLSRYGLMNAITRTAQDVPDYDRATEMESLGYQVLELPNSDWKQIANAN